MIHVDDQELLKRAANVSTKGEAYKLYVFTQEIWKKKLDQLLAELRMSIRRSAKSKMTEQELTDRAQETQTYKDLFKKYEDALIESGRTMIEFRTANTECEAMRSALSSRKTEIKSFGG